MVSFSSLSQIAFLVPALLSIGVLAAPQSSVSSGLVVTATVYPPSQTGATTTTVTASSTSTALTNSVSSTVNSTDHAIKTLVDCNVEGVASSSMAAKLRHAKTESSFLDCQTYCFFDTPCQAYSFDPSTQVCNTYITTIDVTDSTDTGIFFSNKYPKDSSNYCYGTTGY
ncbi:hypothetical protein UCRPC4_g05044 [Phaeomoniella chlamydospora]|uniref:Uncharacterized protein n=1 Tax=Phaeomoniella chlamydospora TaxID=158046 RepID=A0A0G2E5S8_PHACM|nr:hypothetical protein UCRPC4_g05044 [Phaeomoniella chlamydospora]